MEVPTIPIAVQENLIKCIYNDYTVTFATQSLVQGTMPATGQLCVRNPNITSITLCAFTVLMGVTIYVTQAISSYAPPPYWFYSYVTVLP